jgi:hypothetical protein
MFQKDDGKGVAQCVLGLSGRERAISHATPTNRSEDDAGLAAKSPVVVHRVFRQGVTDLHTVSLFRGCQSRNSHCFGAKRDHDGRPPFSYEFQVVATFTTKAH